MQLTMGKWRLRVYDRRSWTLDEWAVPTRGKNRGGEPQWCRREEHSQSLPQALQRVFEYEPRDEPGEFDADHLSDFLAKVKEVADRVTSATVDGE